MTLFMIAPPTSKAEFCPHLGLREDEQTCLAYPSEWNLCYRAKPVWGVSLEHQRKICLSPVYARCPLFQRERVGPLPKQLRGARPAIYTRRTILILLLILLALGLYAAWRYLPLDEFFLIDAIRRFDWRAWVGELKSRPA
jgi:hypothetical protein